MLIFKIQLVIKQTVKRLIPIHQSDSQKVYISIQKLRMPFAHTLTGYYSFSKAYLFHYFI